MGNVSAVVPGRLFLMLQRFPVESKGRRKKLQEVTTFFRIFLFCSSKELVIILWVYLFFYLFSAFWFWQVGYVTTICFTCFLVRCIMVSLSEFFGVHLHYLLNLMSLSMSRF